MCCSHQLAIQPVVKRYCAAVFAPSLGAGSRSKRAESAGKNTDRESCGVRALFMRQEIGELSIVDTADESERYNSLEFF